MSSLLLWSTVLVVAFNAVFALDNGLALKPPMGWISWQRFRCNLDCTNFPNDCISEVLYKRMGDALVKNGYLALGYNTINIDDCWALKERDANGRLVADPDRFPSGIKALAKYMHDRGLKLGIYGDAGTYTCAGYPGSQGNAKIDAETFAEWDVDMLKFDGCNVANESDMPKLYQDMTRALNETNKPILYSCEWPWYLKNSVPNYGDIADSCNLWRNYQDIFDTFDSVKNTIDFYVKNQDLFAQFQKPGAFFDPDQLIIGNFGLSFDEAQLQMAVWTIWGAPLLMSNDLEKISDDFKNILQNKDVIDLNQDPEGKMGKMIKQFGSVKIFARPVLPKIGTSYSFGIAAIYTPDGGMAANVNLKGKDFGLTDPRGYNLVDLFSHTVYGNVKADDDISFTVNPSGARLFKATLNGA